MYGVDPKDMGPRVVEAINMILEIWTSDAPYELKGQFWNLTLKENLDAEVGLGGLHKPLQRPHPPIHFPSISRGSVGMRAAAARGFLPISHHMVSEDVLLDHWKTYTEGAESAGREANLNDWCVSRNIFVADTTEEAKRLARTNSMGKCIEYILELTRRGPGLEMWRRTPDMPDEECNLDYFCDEVFIVGDPDEVTRGINALRERIGPFGTLVLVAHDWDDREKWIRNLELFAREVVPNIV